MAVRGEKATVVVDGREGPLFDGVLRGTPVFSLDARRVAYAGKRRGKWQIIADGLVRYSYPLVKEYSVQFTPDGSRLLCLASYQRDGRQFAVSVDGSLTEDFQFPPASVLIPSGPGSYQAVVFEGNVISAKRPEDDLLENGAFARLEIRMDIPGIQSDPRAAALRQRLSQSQ